MPRRCVRKYKSGPKAGRCKKYSGTRKRAAKKRSGTKRKRRCMTYTRKTKGGVRRCKKFGKTYL